LVNFLKLVDKKFFQSVAALVKFQHSQQFCGVSG